MLVPKKKKIAKEWTVYDLGLNFCPKKKIKKIIKKHSSKKVRKYLKTIA